MARAAIAMILGATLAVDGMAIQGTHPARSAMPRMSAADEWPPPLDAVHVFSVNFGHDEELPMQLALTQMPVDKGAELLPMWKHKYADMGELADHMLSLAREGGQTSGTPLGFYLDGVDGDEHGMAVVRFVADAADPVHKLMIIDAVLCSPSMPQQSWPPMHSAMVRSLHAIGEANEMTVQSWVEYDI